MAKTSNNESAVERLKRLEAEIESARIDAENEQKAKFQALPAELGFSTGAEMVTKLAEVFGVKIGAGKGKGTGKGDGTRTRIDEQKRAELEKHFKAGKSVSETAKLTGIGYQTVRNWHKKLGYDKR